MKAKSTRARLSRAQFEIMNVVWELGKAGATDVLDALAKRRPIARTTVLTTMRRLEEKGWLRHEIQGNRFLYVPTATRRKTTGQIVRNLVDTAFSGSADGLVLALLDSHDLSRDEIDRIRALIDRADKETTR